MRLELPEGAWAELADPAKVTERKREPARRAFVQAAQAQANGGDAGPILDALKDAGNKVTVAQVTSWSFGEEVTPDALLDLPGDAYDVLVKAATDRVSELLPEFETVDEVPPDPKAPTPS